MPIRRLAYRLTGAVEISPHPVQSLLSTSAKRPVQYQVGLHEVEPELTHGPLSSCSATSTH